MPRMTTDEGMDVKLPVFSKDHASRLNVLTQNPNFSSLIAALDLEENNIVMVMAKLDATDPSFPVKYAVYQGRLQEIKLLKTIFQKVKKEKDGS